MTGDVPPAQAGGLLSALRARGENAGEILGFARALREHAAPFSLQGDGLIDTCGTGGDGLGTFNVSTLAGLVAAACGARVAKHGNRAVSSRCGSADVLEALGVKIDPPPAVVARGIEAAGFGFLFAPGYHPTLRQLAGLRRELGFRSVFNLAGPLANPARVTRQVVGVPAPAYLRPVAEALLALGVVHALVVHGDDGADEISLTGATHVCEVRPQGLESRVIHPEDAGLAACRPEDLAGGDAKDNAAIAHRLLDGARGPAHDFVVLNAAAALVVAGKTGSLREGAEQARDALLSGRARAVLDTVRRISQEVA
jgi:anthranilate phosphoribosyltransferase